MIIDAHLHLPPTNPKLSFIESKKKLMKELDKNKINYAILIPDNKNNSKIGDLDTCLNLIKDSKRLFLLGTIDIRIHGKEMIEKLDFLFNKGKIKGIKIFPGHDPIYPTDRRLIPVYKLCDKYNLPIVIHTGENSRDSKLGKYNDPKLIVKIAKRFPNLKILICHYFNPKIEYCYNTTKDYPNIYFDSSALVHQEVFEMSGEKILKKFIKKTILERPGKFLFGTDYCCEGCDMSGHINLIKGFNLPKKLEEEVFWKNADKLFKLKIGKHL
ncbi:MAG: amidohydrolase family protein [archaeon]